jgi:hypothetical protein
MKLVLGINGLYIGLLYYLKISGIARASLPETSFLNSILKKNSI